MSEWTFNEPADPVRFDFSKDFDEQVKALRSVNGGHMPIGSHVYWVLKALFEGEIIDGYARMPKNADGFPVNNVRNRISDLRNNWNIRIGHRTVEGKKYVEYMLEGARSDV